MTEQNFSRELKEKILSYYNYLWTKLGGTDTKEQELSDLPGSLRDELSKCIKGPILAQVPFLEHSNPEVMKSIRAKLKPSIFLPGDTIINAGDFGEEMYLIERGKIMVFSADRTVLFAVLERGDYFGESSLLQGEKRVATVVSPGYSDCLVLTKPDYEDIMMNHPIEAKHLEEKIKEVLNKKKLIDQSVEVNLKDHSKLETTAMTQKGENAKEVNNNNKLQLMSLEVTWAHPDSGFRICWDLTLFLICIFNVLKIPYQIAFRVDENFFLIDYCLDVILLVDLWMSTHKFISSEGGKYVLASKRSERAVRTPAGAP